MPEQYTGTCPICGVSLIVIPGNKLQCPDNHYICDRWAFERRWDTFRDSVAQGGYGLIDELLVDLVSLNELDISPAIVVQLQKKAITNDNEP